MSRSTPTKNQIDQSGLIVSHYLNRTNNNFDLIRLIAAIAVIYGHSFSLSPELVSVDIFHKYTEFYAAGVAVKVFFFLSGILVTNNFLSKPSIYRYVVGRFFRTWPALAFVLFRLPFDASYGAYLWGFPIQQSLACFFPLLIGNMHFVTAAVLALVMGTISWHFVERPCLNNRLLRRASRPSLG